MNKLFSASKYVTVFAIIMFIIESFYPLGDLVKFLLGEPGLILGHLIAAWGFIGLLTGFLEFTRYLDNLKK